MDRSFFTNWAASPNQQRLDQQTTSSVRNPTSQHTSTQVAQQNWASQPQHFPHQLAVVQAPLQQPHIGIIGSPMNGQTSYQSTTTTTMTTRQNNNSAFGSVQGHSMPQSMFYGSHMGSGNQASSVNSHFGQPSVAQMRLPMTPLHQSAASAQSFTSSMTQQNDGAIEASGLIPSSAPLPNTVASASAQAQAQQAQDKAPEQLKIAYQSTQAATSHTTVNTTSRTSAALQSSAALKAYDDRVSSLLTSSTVASGACPRGYRWYYGKYGYLCGGGHHLVSLAEAEALLQGRRPRGPYVERVNPPSEEVVMTLLLSGRIRNNQEPSTSRKRSVTPPPDGWHERMHWVR